MTRQALRLRIPLFAILFALCMTSVTGCFTTTPIVEPFSTSVPPDTSRDQIVKAMKTAASEREWSLVPKGDDFIGSTTERSHMIKVRFAIKKSQIDAYYVASDDMEYDGHNIHKKYHMWIDRYYNSVHRALRRDRNDSKK
jgi:hypothetical protein